MNIVDDIENKLRDAVYRNDMDALTGIWSDIYNDDFILRDAMIVEYNKNYFEKDYFFKYPTIVDMILSNYSSISRYTYGEISAIILSNKDLARKRVGDKTYLEKLLMNNGLRLNDESKKFCISEALHTYEVKSRNKKVLKPLYSNNSAFDLRYYILMNKSFEEEEKKELICAFYLNDNDFYNYFRQWEEQLNREICDGKYGTSLMYSVSFEELKEYYNSIKIAKRKYNKIVLHSFLGNNPPSVYEAQSYKKIKK